MDRNNSHMLSNWRNWFNFNFSFCRSGEPQQDLSGVPYIIISDFEKSSETDCIKMDNKNEKIYNLP